ncbi:MAG TPA: hypothetical protein VGD67_13945 [Pseudonocardiaceae bacterium]
MSIAKVGQRLLSALVPTVTADASCGRCSRTPSSNCCSTNYRRIYYVDVCGNVCRTACEYAPTYC